MDNQDSRRKLLYVAAPYTRPEPVSNAHAVCRVAMEIYERTEWCPFVPHLSMLWQAVSPRPESHWYEYDLHVMRRCNAIVRLPGYSVGADVEVEEAVKAGMLIVPFEWLPKEAIDLWTQRPLQ